MQMYPEQIVKTLIARSSIRADWSWGSSSS